MNRIKRSDEEIIETACRCYSAHDAAKVLGISYSAYKRHAVRLNCFKTVQGGKGKTKTPSKQKITLDEILSGNRPNTNRGIIKREMLAEGKLEYKCYECGINEWRGKSLSLHLEHKNGDNTDHREENLTLLCPNCHSQTPTYCGRNKGKKRA